MFASSTAQCGRAVVDLDRTGNRGTMGKPGKLGLMVAAGVLVPQAGPRVVALVAPVDDNHQVVQAPPVVGQMVGQEALVGTPVGMRRWGCRSGTRWAQWPQRVIWI